LLYLSRWDSVGRWTLYLGYISLAADVLALSGAGCQQCTFAAAVGALIFMSVGGRCSGSTSQDTVGH